MKKRHLIFTDAPTYLGVSETIGRASLEFTREVDLPRIKKFLEDHWKELDEIHLYKKGTVVGLKWLLKDSEISLDEIENTEPNRVKALYGQTKIIVNVKCRDKESDPSFEENWENGSCKLTMVLVNVNKPTLEYDDLDDFVLEDDEQ